MAQRHIQLFRNNAIAAYVSFAAARTAAEAQFATLDLKDGELALFSYQLGTQDGQGNVNPSGPVHTLVGVKRTNGIEILANYDELHYDIEQIIDGLDSEVTNAVIPEGAESDTTTPVIVTIKQENGKLTSVTVDTTNLSNDFQEIINALDYTHADHFAQAEDKKSFNIYATNQVDGEISEEVDGTIYFTDGVTSTNPGATKTYVDTAINNLNVTNVDVATKTGNVVEIYNVKEDNGKIAQSNKVATLAEVAITGAAAQVSVADANDLIAATTVEGALAEIAAEIDAMDLAATDVVAMNADNTALQASKISEVDGKVAVATAATVVEFNKAISSTNKVATMADLKDAEYTGENAIAVDNDANKVSLKLDSTDKVLTQSDAGLLVNLGLTWGNNNDNNITLTGKDGVEIASIDASKFIKDGMLEDVELVTVVKAEDGTITIDDVAVAEGESVQGITTSGRYFKFTWNTYTYNESGEATKTTKVEYLNVESLVDSYTAGNDWIVINQSANTISHAQVGAAGTFGNANDVTAIGTTTFVVPTLTIDAAGHVTAAADKTVTIDLSTTTASEVLNATTANAKFVAVKTSAVADSNDYIITSEVQTQAVASATDEENGLATAKDVRDFTEHINCGTY